MLNTYCQELHYDFNKVIYIGNDINDFGVMKLVGYPLVPLDISRSTLEIAKIVIPKDRGYGVITKFLVYIVH